MTKWHTYPFDKHRIFLNCYRTSFLFIQRSHQNLIIEMYMHFLNECILYKNPCIPVISTSMYIYRFNTLWAYCFSDSFSWLCQMYCIDIRQHPTASIFLSKLWKSSGKCTVQMAFLIWQNILTSVLLNLLLTYIICNNC